jgi:hypothetical protein
VGDYQEYLDRFPNGMFATMARRRIAELGGTAKAPSRPAPAAPKTTAVVTPTAGPSASAPAPAPQNPAPNLAQSAPVPPAGPSGKQFPADAGDPNSVAFVTANANKVHDRAALPAMPSTPQFPTGQYPDCRENFQNQPDPIARVVQINACLTALTSFYDQTLNGFARTMISHQEAISRLYSDRVAGNQQYSPESQQNFYREMRLEHARSNPDGDHFAAYREAKTRYEEDRAYLQDRYCFNTGTCGGYPVPAGVGTVPK